MHTFWPGVKMEGWELDGSIFPVARDHMGLRQLEDSGALVSPQTCKAQLPPSRVSMVGWVYQALHHAAAKSVKHLY